MAHSPLPPSKPTSLPVSTRGAPSTRPATTTPTRSQPHSPRTTFPLFTHIHPLPTSPTSPSSLFHAFHPPTRTPVTVKTYLKRDLSRIPHSARASRVAVEREALARLSASPHAPHLLAATHDTHAVALIMSRVRGVSAAALASSPREAPRERERRGARVVAALVDALQSVHAKKVLHLDLRLENVVVVRREGAPEKVVLVDFGSAALEDVVEEGRDFRATVSSGVLAPELEEDGAVPSRAADVWGVGVAAYRMLHSGKSVEWSGGEVVFDDGVGEAAREFVRECLQRCPEERLGVSVCEEQDRRKRDGEVDYQCIRRHRFLVDGANDDC